MASDFSMRPKISQWKTGLVCIWVTLYFALYYSVPAGTGVSQSRLLFEISMLDSLWEGSAKDQMSSGLNFLPQRIPIFIFAFAIICSATSWGYLGLYGLGVLPCLRRLEKWIFSYGVGLSLCSTVMLGAGKCAWLYQQGWWLVLIGGPLISILTRVRKTRVLPVSKDVLHRGMLTVRERRTFVICLLICLPVVVLIFLGSTLPPASSGQYFDVNEYHLQAPKEFFLNGAITFLPHNVYSSMPLGTEMLSLLSMVVCGDWWLGALVGQVVIASFTPMTAVLLVAAGRRFFDPLSGYLAAMIYLLTPAIFYVSTTALVEGGLCFFVAGSCFAMGIAWHQPKSEDCKAEVLFKENTSGLPLSRKGVSEKLGRFLFLSGLLSGFAAAIKYPGLIYAIVPLGLTVMIVSLVQKRWFCSALNPTPSFHWKQTGIRTLIFSFGVILTFGPWAIRNILDTGNPLYPLLWEWLGGISWRAEQNYRWWLVHSPGNFQWITLLADIKRVTLDHVHLNPWLFGFLPLGLWQLRGKPVVRWIVLFPLIIFFGWWGLTHRIDRFWYPLIPFVALLSGVGVRPLFRTHWRNLGIVLAAPFLVVTLVTTTTSHAGWGMLRRELYTVDLHWARQTFPAAPISILNDRLPDDAKVVVIGDAAVFPLEHSVFYSTVFDDTVFMTCWVSSGDSTDYSIDVERLKERLQELQVTHIYIDWAEIARYRSPGNYGFSEPVTPDLFETLVTSQVLDPIFNWELSWKQLPLSSRQVFRDWQGLADTEIEETSLTAIVHSLYAVR